MKIVLWLVLLPLVSSLTVDPCVLDVLKEKLHTLNDAAVGDMPCVYSGFTGPIGNAIATLQPTKLSRYAEDHSRSMVDNMAALGGSIPILGDFVSIALEKFSEFGFEGDDDIINGIISEIEQQMDALKEYVDAKVQQHEYTQLSQKLIGIFRMAHSCADYKKPEHINDLEKCLISFNTKMDSSVGSFLPENDNIIAYELILPLFRQYADMQLTVTQNLLRVAMKLGKKSSKKIYVSRLKDQSNEFYDFSVKAVNKIVHVHTTFKKMICNSGTNWNSPTNPFSSSDGSFGECSQNIHGKICKSRNIARGMRNGPKRNSAARRKAIQCVNKAVNDYKKRLTADLRKYWDLEIMKSARNWKKIAEKAEAIEK